MSLIRFRDHDWFVDATRYWSSRFFPIEQRLFTSFRHVELHTDNRKTFSYEFASILRDCGSVFASLVDAFLRHTKGKPKGRQYDFASYRAFLRQEQEDIYLSTVQIRSLFPGGVLVPFEELKAETGTPQWWDAYNQVKHSEQDSSGQGNLENCVTALAALALLGTWMGLFTSDHLFVNVGLRYAEDSIDMSAERRLFP